MSGGYRFICDKGAVLGDVIKMTLCVLLLLLLLELVYITIMSPVVLYGFETWFVTLREEHRLKVFENGMLRKIFGQCRGLHNEFFMTCTPHQIILGGTNQEE